MPPNHSEFRGPISVLENATVKHAIESWRLGATSVAVVSTLLATIAVALLGIINDDHDSVEASSSPVGDLLYAVSFSAILLNVASTLGAFIILKELLQLPGRGTLPINVTLVCGSLKVLDRVGIRPRWFRVMVGYVAVTSSLGTVSVMGQIILYIWVTENVPGRGVKYAMTALCGVLFLPFLAALA